MDDVTKLMNYKKRITTLENEIQKTKGILESSIEALNTELETDIQDSDELMNLSNKRIKELEDVIKKNQIIFEELMDEIETVMENNDD